jgi:hypothetical protein
LGYFVQLSLLSVGEIPLRENVVNISKDIRKALDAAKLDCSKEIAYTEPKAHLSLEYSAVIATKKRS